ncbi:MAG: alginate export family protein [Woeseiaceae bacterium]
MFYRISMLAVVAVVAGLSARAEAQDEDANRFEFTVDARARVEEVDEDNALQDASALTLRLRAGLKTPSRRGLSALAELEAVENVGAEDYNSGSNGRTEYSAILDPEDVELNQLVVRYLDGSHYLQVGRQRMVLDNARFFGDVGYRQNQQTYDAVSYMNTALQGQQFLYAYMSRARRFLSDEHPVGEIDMNSHLLNYRLQRLNSDTFTAYAYLIDMDTPAVVQNSTKTFGLRYSGTYATTAADLLYTLEYANQSDYADGASTNDADYVAVELGVKFKNEWLMQFGQERLGGDGVYGFQTPFGTNHAFNGFADIFAARTPATGLVDSYARLVVPLFGARILLTAHDFGADQGGADHGSELNLQVEKRFAERFGINLMIADYRADNFAVDTTKWALWLDFRY